MTDERIQKGSSQSISDLNDFGNLLKRTTEKQFESEKS